MKDERILQSVDVPEPLSEVEEAERTGTTVTTEVTAEITIGTMRATKRSVTTAAGNTLSAQCVPDSTSAQPDATRVKEWDT